MHTYSLQIGQNKGLLWPQRCVVCGQPPAALGTARCSVVTKAGYWLLFWTYTTRTIEISYPLCARHRILRLLPSLISSRNLLNLGAGFLICFLFVFGAIVPTLMWIVGGVPIEKAKDGQLSGPEMAMIWTTIFAIGLGLLLYSRRSAPVQIHDVQNQTLTLSIANAQYAAAFEAANKSSIIKRTS